MRCRPVSAASIEAEVQPSPGPYVTIEILRGRATQKSRVMTGPSLLIGSDPRCDVQMRSPNVAAKHCLISRQDGVVRATRLSTDHPLLLNGKPTAEDPVGDGDTLAIGPFELRIRIAAESVSNAPAVPSLEPNAVHRPRFALLDRRQPTKTFPAPMQADESHTASPSQPMLEQRPRDSDERDERLQEWEKRLEAQEAEIGRTRDELSATLADCRRRRQTLDDRRRRLLSLRVKRREDTHTQRSRFAALLGEWERRTKLLDEREANVVSREVRCQRLAEEIDARQAVLEVRERKTQESLAALEYRRTALEKERSLLDKEWQRLFARQQDVADRKSEVDRQAQHVAAEAALLAGTRRRVDAAAEQVESLAAKTATRSAEIDAQAVRLKGRERQLDERAQSVAAADEMVRDRERQLNLDAERLQTEAAAVQRQLQSQVQAVESRRAELNAAVHRHEFDKQTFEVRQSAWKAELASLSKAKEDLDRRASLLAARERALAESQSRAQDPVEFERRLAELRREQERLTAESSDAIARRKALDAETAKLGEIAVELERRQNELLDWERAIADAAAADQEKFDRESARLKDEQQSLDLRAEEQRRSWERLKSSAARIGGRRKVMYERMEDLESRFEACKRDIETLVESRNRVRAALEEHQAESKRREKIALDWLKELRSDSEKVAEVHRRFTRQFDAAVGAAAPSTLRLSLREMTSELSRMQQRIAAGDQVLRSGPQAPTPEAAPRIAQPAAETPTPVAAVRHANPAPPPPPKWLFKLVELGLADEEVLTFLLVSARERRTSVEDALVDQGVVTKFQLDCVSSGRTDELQTGPAKILDLLHRGSTATTHLAALPEFDRPVALRLMHPKVLHSEAAKAAYFDYVRSAQRIHLPSTAAVLGPFQHEDRIGLLAEHVSGERFVDAAVSMTPQAIVESFIECLNALLAGQRLGRLHRSLRPSRILVSASKRIALLGFGEPDWLIRLHRCEKGAADDLFISPEERSGQAVDARSDFHSLCRVFLEAISRRPSAESASESMPRGFARLLARGCSDDPNQRCRSFTEVIHEAAGLLANDRLRFAA